MVNSPHEAHHRAFQEIPQLFSRAFGLLGLPDPGPASVSVLNCDVTEVKPVERRVDTLLRLECADNRTYLLVVEAQSKKDPAKARSWGYYLGFLANKYPRHDPMLLVVCRDRHTAAWAEGPFRIGHPSRANISVAPFVLGPDNVPVVADIDQAAADLPLAVFSALTHSNDAGIGAILEVLAAALAKSGNDDLTTLYADLTASGLGDSPAATIWRQLMGAGLFELRGFVAEGLRDEGVRTGWAQALLQLFRARGIELNEAERERITGCRDTAILDQWFQRALTAVTAADVFGDG